jgi:pimeloyl-ACP methyl ester carboxylesterase
MTEITAKFIGAEKTIVSFTGLITEPRGINTEFFNVYKLGYNVIFVSDLSRSWFNNIDIDKIKSHIQTDEVMCIGNSMGAFNATMFSNYHPVSKVIGFAPQYSVHPDIVPWEPRWTGLRKRINYSRCKEMQFADSTDYLFIAGSHSHEVNHINMIPDQQNISKFVIDGDHGIAAQLKTKEKLYPIIENYLIDKDVSHVEELL